MLIHGDMEIHFVYRIKYTSLETETSLYMHNSSKEVDVGKKIQSAKEYRLLNFKRRYTM